MTRLRFHSAIVRSFAALLPLSLIAASDPPPENLGPADIVAAAPDRHWLAIAPDDLLVMELAPDAAGRARRVTIQLMPAPFSQGWVDNIRKLAAAHWWDDTAIVRVQDNYVVQWGDPDGEDEAKAKPLLSTLETVPEQGYTASFDQFSAALGQSRNDVESALAAVEQADDAEEPRPWAGPDAYGQALDFFQGWPLAGNDESVWPVHCYAMVGVGRNLSPDTGSGAELYTVIGHAPRHLDRNIALVGRVVEGIEHLSSLPRGTGPLGFYETPQERSVIRSVRLATQLPGPEQPRIEYLDSMSDSFVAYARARANRKDAFFNIAAGGADICNIPVPMRKITQ